MEPLTRRGVVRVRYPLAVADDQQREVYSWGGSVGFAIVGTVLAVVLILVFTELEDLVGQFWSQVIYFPTIVFVVVAPRCAPADGRRGSHPAVQADADHAGRAARPFVVPGAGRGRHRDDRGRVGLGRDAELMWTSSGFVRADGRRFGLRPSGRPWQQPASLTWVLLPTILYRTTAPPRAAGRSKPDGRSGRPRFVRPGEGRRAANEMAMAPDADLVGLPARCRPRRWWIALVHRPRMTTGRFPRAARARRRSGCSAPRAARGTAADRSPPPWGRSPTTVTGGGAAGSVRYYLMRDEGGSFEPHQEVDELLWLLPSEARGHLSYDRDRVVLDRALPLLAQGT